ncbi:MAG: Fic family protein [Patulibacter minatonensis]
MEPQDVEITAEIELGGIAWIDPSFLDWLTDAAEQALATYASMLPASAQADRESHYAIAAPLSAQDTQEGLLTTTGIALLHARNAGWAGQPLTADLVLELHRAIFGPVFGDRTLGFREPPARGEHRLDDGVSYPIWVRGARSPEPTIVVRRGAKASQVLRGVRDACDAFEREVPTALGDPVRSAEALARLYVRLIRIHPFTDGNGRTAWAALQFAAGRLRFPFVQSSPTMEARLALGDAIRDGNNVGPLADHIRRNAAELPGIEIEADTLVLGGEPMSLSTDVGALTVLHGALQSAIASMDDANTVEEAFFGALAALGVELEIEELPAIDVTACEPPS